jgi:alpha-mannosidase
MSISHIDGPVLKPFFKFLRKSFVGVPVTLLALKIIEFMGNGVYLHGRHDLGRVKWTSFKKLILTGQSHLDAAWRWRTKQGIIKAKATILKALDHIDELDEFTFSQPSPQYYQWMKDYYPEIYDRLKKAVKAGRFIPIGGEWVESDTNIPDGESLVRQRLYGQRFYLKEFGFISDIEFMQDCFGFNWNLPQIYKKSGARMFGTGKLFWNSTTKIPIGMCHWEGPDGTRLPMIHIHFGYFIPINYGKEYPCIYLLGKPGKQLLANYTTPPKKYFEWYSKDLMLENIFGYGLGDGGHGPVEAEIAVVSMLRRLWPKKFKHHQRGDFYHLFRKYFPRWAIWQDEWYLDYHRGTYTSVARVKRGNREGENRIESLESMAAWYSLCGFPDMREEFEKHWKILLYNQFHDILPGSSCPEVYVDYDQDYAKLQAFFDRTEKQLVDYLRASLPAEKQSNSVCIQNSLSWARGGVSQIYIHNQSQGVCRTLKGDVLPTQIVPYRWGSLAANDREFVALTWMPAIGSFGWMPVIFDPKSSNPEMSQTQAALKSYGISPVNFKDLKDRVVLENGLITAVIDKASGWLIEITTPEHSTNILAQPSNRLRLYAETAHTDAWNIDPKYREKEIPLDGTPTAFTIIESGPIRTTIEVEHRYDQSRFIQRIALVAGSSIVHTSMDIDLQTPKIICKLGIYPKVRTNTISAEIPYAYIDRAIVGQTKLDKARWEHAGQKWYSLSDESLTISLLNNGKYGYNAIQCTDGYAGLEATVVRSPVFTGYAKETMFVNRAPNGGIDPTMPQYTDLEFHRDIQYGIMVSKGGWKSGTWQAAQEFNRPLRGELYEIGETLSKPSSPIPESFLTIDPASVHCSSVKYTEDPISIISLYSDPSQIALIFRCVEKIGLETQTTLTLPSHLRVIRADMVDLLELNPKPLEIKGNHQVSFMIHPYEITTLRVVMKK